MSDNHQYTEITSQNQIEFKYVMAKTHLHPQTRFSEERSHYTAHPSAKENNIFLTQQ